MSTLTPSEHQLAANANAAALRVSKNAYEQSMATARSLDAHKTEQSDINLGIMTELKNIRKMLEGAWFDRPWIRRLSMALTNLILFYIATHFHR